MGQPGLAEVSWEPLPEAKDGPSLAEAGGWGVEG